MDFTGFSLPQILSLAGSLSSIVADISEVVVINMITAQIESRIPVKGAKGLNDITADNRGTVFVSDSELGNVIRIYHGKVSVYLSDLPGANGLKAIGKDLYNLTDGHLYKSSPGNRKAVPISAMIRFIISCLCHPFLKKSVIAYRLQNTQ